MLSVFVGAITLTWSLTAAAPLSPTAANLPNIVYILADDLGYGDVKCMNPDGKIPTPCIDRLAGQGMIFTDAHSGSSVCTPTRYGILTGRYCWRTSLRHSALYPYDPPLIASDTLTVPQLLRQKGYQTACIGKWHLGWDWPKNGTEYDFAKPIANGPTTRGFDSYFGADVPNYPPYCFIENDRTVGIPSETLPLQKQLLIAPVPGPSVANWKLEEILPTLSHRAVKYIESRADDKQPFFLYVALTSPHEPVAPTAEWQGKSGMHPVADFMMETDAVIGNVIEALDRSGLANNTLVIFTSDNGHAPYNGRDELAAHGHRVSGPYRGFKADVWDGGHRIPFVARWPGKVKAGSRCGDVICLTDLMATVGAITGAPLPDSAGVDSVNILPDLLGTAEGPMREAVVHQACDGSLAIRHGQWKLEFCPGSGGLWTPPLNPDAVKQSLPKMQLYDMQKDIAEHRNVYAEYPEIVERLTTLMTKYISEGRSTLGTPQKNDVPVPLWLTK
jgi:arylsulfatase A-like enzyme